MPDSPAPGATTLAEAVPGPLRARLAASGLRALSLAGRRLLPIARVQALGVAGARLGTPFAVTTEGDASDVFKRVLAEARDDEVVEFTGVAGLPARAVGTPWLKAYLKIEAKLQAVAHARTRCTKAFDCLARRGLRDGLAGWGRFCIHNQLAAALRGELNHGLFYRGVGALPSDAQISVRELVERLLSRAAAEPAAARPGLAAVPAGRAGPERGAGGSIRASGGA